MIGDAVVEALLVEAKSGVKGVVEDDDDLDLGKLSLSKNADSCASL